MEDRPIRHGEHGRDGVLIEGVISWRAKRRPKKLLLRKKYPVAAQLAWAATRGAEESPTSILAGVVTSLDEYYRSDDERLYRRG
jgi:hypothetical protein